MSDAVRELADAVLYEGYILWPYRRSSIKNQKRWTFGGVYPPAHSAAHPDDRSVVQTQCLLDGDDCEVTVRFLQVVRREAAPDAELLPWDEAVERELVLHRSEPVAIAAGRSDDGSVERSWRELRGRVEIEREPARDLTRVTVRVANETPWQGDDREDALRSTFCSTHVVLSSRDGGFVSLIDPPAEHAQAAASCENVGLWPVLVGTPRTMLAAPIILEDYPQIAPESPGDFFDSTEIDRMLVLNVLALTEEERAEMVATDPRAREILERCDALDRDDVLRLHGAFRR